MLRGQLVKLAYKHNEIITDFRICIVILPIHVNQTCHQRRTIIQLYSKECVMNTEGDLKKQSQNILTCWLSPE